MKTLAPCTDETKDDFLVPGERHQARRRNECRRRLGAREGSDLWSFRCQEDRRLLHRWHADGPRAISAPEVASSAVGHAKDMKDKGAVVYSIGIFQGADPAKYPDPAGRFQREQVHARRVEQLPVCDVFIREHELVVGRIYSGASAIVRRVPTAKTPRSTRARPTPMS